MLFYRISRVGFPIIRALSRGISTRAYRTGYTRSSYCQRHREYMLQFLSPTILYSFNKMVYINPCQKDFEYNDQGKDDPETWWFHGAIFQRNCYCSTTAANADSKDKGEQQEISVIFVDKDGEEKHIKVPVGMSMLEAAHQNDIELEGACEGSLACSTCHVIVMDMEQYNKLEDPTDEENDMLDLAFGLTETSRLGCQVIAKPELDGVRLAIPSATRNFAVDGYVPKPH